MIEVFYTLTNRESVSVSLMTRILSDRGTFLPSWKIRQLLRQQDSGQRFQSLLGYLLLADALTERGERADLSAMEKGEYGKPFFPDGPKFNISHCRCITVCAVADSPVGIDIERRDALEKSEAVRAWVIRESYGKYTGIGAALQPPHDASPTWLGELLETYILSIWSAEKKENIVLREMEY